MKELLMAWANACDDANAADSRRDAAQAECESAADALIKARQALLCLAPEDGTRRNFLLPPTNDARRTVVTIWRSGDCVYAQLVNVEVL